MLIKSNCYTANLTLAYEGSLNSGWIFIPKGVPSARNFLHTLSAPRNNKDFIWAFKAFIMTRADYAGKCEEYLTPYHTY